MNWFSENHRLGFKNCTSAGYTLSLIADYFFLLALIGLLAFGGYIAYLFIKGNYSHSSLFLFLVPIISYVISWLLNAVTSGIAVRNGFKYDYEKDECTWDQS